jgi:hypothetical protein
LHIFKPIEVERGNKIPGDWNKVLGMGLDMKLGLGFGIGLKMKLGIRLRVKARYGIGMGIWHGTGNDIGDW